MLQLDSLLLDAFYKESMDYLVGARVQKIQQPTRREVVLMLRNQGESRKLYININPNFYHICFMNKINEIRRNIEIPKQPPMFCMLLRKHMESARIVAVNKPQNERILELVFENYNELGDRIEECLSIELMGKHSNIILYNTDNNIILGCAHNVGSEKSKERELAGGLPYIYPPKQNKKNLLLTKYNSFKSTVLKSEFALKKAIADNYFSLTQSFVEDVCVSIGFDSNSIANLTPENSIQILFLNLHQVLDTEERNYSVDADLSKYSFVFDLGITFDSINNLIDEYFSHNIEKSFIRSLKSTLLVKINKELKKQKSILQNRQKQIDKKDKADLYLKKGNLLTANVYALKSFDSKVTLYDYEENINIDIDMDTNLSAIENAKRYFDLYAKTKKTWQVAQELALQTSEEIKYLEQLLYDVEQSSTLLELKEIMADFADEPDKMKNKKDVQVKVEKINIDGCDVYVGKNSKQNDYLYSKISSAEDLWFHTLNTPGSHVVVKSHNPKQKISDETILKVAQLAKQNSSAKYSTKVSVVYTMRKYIKRPNKTKSGFVVYKNENEICVD